MDPMSAIEASGQAEIVVPHGNLVLVADYARDGNDLILTGPDGAVVTIAGYFAGASPATLVSADGARIPGDVVARLIEGGAGSPAQPASGTGEPIGTVDEAEGAITATLPDGDVVSLTAGDPVYQDWLVETGDDASVGITLTDGTRLGLSQSGRLLLDEFVFNPDTGAGASALTVLQGVLATVTGEIGKTNPENVSIRALAGTIGIRGTTIIIEIDQIGRVEVTVAEGRISLTLPDGRTFSMDDAGDFVTVPVSGPPSLTRGGEERIEQLLSDPETLAALERARVSRRDDDGGDDDDGDGDGDGEDDGGGQPGDGGQTGFQIRLTPEGLVVAPLLPPPSPEGESDGAGQSQRQMEAPPGDDNEAPEFGADSYAFTLAENTEGSTAAVALGTVAASDPDGGTVRYSITAGNTGNHFAIDAGTGAVTYVGPGEDFEAGRSYTLTVQADDGNGATDTATVTVNVADVNEAPAFGQSSYAFNLAENADGSTTAVALGTVGAADPDSGDTLRYSITGGNTGNLFAIDSATGALTFVGSDSGDYEGSPRPTYSLTVEARDRASGGLADTATVTVSLTGVNEAPAFGQSSYTFNLAENADGSTTAVALGTVGAADPDSGDTVRYSITGGNTGNLFAIDSATGALTFVGSDSGDYEGSPRPTYSLTVEADDGNGATDTATVTVNVADVNEAPAFGQSSYAFNLAENADGSTAAVALGTVGAADPDSGDTVRYSITGGNTNNLFAIDSATGALTFVGSDSGDYEGSPRPTYSLTVEARDRAGGGLADTATVTVNVADVNEAPVFGQSSYAFNLAENADGSTTAVALGTVGAADPDSGDTLRYSITGGNTGNLFAIDSATGALTFVGSDSGDYEGSPRPTYSLTVEARDRASGGLADTATVTVSLTGVNEAPAFGQSSYTFNLAENADGSTTAVALGTVGAADPDSGDTVRYSITGGNTGNLFAIDSATGALTFVGSDSGDYEGSPRPTYSLTVEARDRASGGLADTATVTVNVADVNEAPAFGQSSYAFNLAENADGSTAAVALGTVGAADPDSGDTVRYSITGGNTNNLFAIDSATGALTFVGSDSGDYEGSPRPTYALTVEARDRASGGLADTATVTVNVADVNEAPVFGQSSYAFTVATGHTNSFGQVSATDEDASGTVSSYAITGGNTGNLFSIDATTGKLSATGNSLGTTTTPHALTVTATSSDGSTSTAQVDVTVVGQPAWQGISGNNRVAIDSSGDYTFYLGGLNYAQSAVTVLGKVDADPDGQGGIGVTYTLDFSVSSDLEGAVYPIYNADVFSVDGEGQIKFKNALVRDHPDYPVRSPTEFTTVLGTGGSDDTLTVKATFSDGSPSITTTILLSNTNPPSMGNYILPTPRPPEPVIEMSRPPEPVMERAMAPPDPILDPGFPGYTVNPGPGGIPPIAPDMGS